MYWSIFIFDNKSQNNDIKRKTTSKNQNNLLRTEWLKTVYISLSGTVLLYFMSFEYFFTAGIFLISFFILSMMASMIKINDNDNHLVKLTDRRNEILCTYSTFLLLFLLFHGASSQGGIFLELYTPAEADQYAWPIGRIILFLPFALFLFFAALIINLRIISGKAIIAFHNYYKFDGMVIIVITLIGYLGALTIWPAKIGVLYAFFIIIAVYSFFKLNNRINSVYTI